MRALIFLAFLLHLVKAYRLVHPRLDVSRRSSIIRMSGYQTPSAAINVRQPIQGPIERTRFQINKLMQRLQSSRLMTKLWRKSRIAFASLFIALSLGNSARASHHTLASQGTQIVAMDKKKSIVKPSGIAQNLKAVEKTLVSNVKDVENKIVRDILEVGEDAKSSWENLVESLRGTKLDALILLIVTSAVIPIFKSLNTSPILGFLLTGVMLGPNGLSWVSDVHMMHVLGELGIVFFLFEMGLELSLDRLKKMKKDVFGLGTSQFVLTTALFSSIAKVAGLSTAAAVTIGGSLSLSSSAFVLQLLKDKGAMGTRYGKASFGILLLQDLAVVPLLVIVELLGKGGAGLGRALTFAGLKALVSLSTMSIVGRVVLNPLFGAVVKSKSQEAFLSIILSTVLIMSFVTKGIGLSDTLGAFLAGLLLAETKYHYQIEADIAPFRGLLLGFFFITVGFSIDPHLVLTEAPKIAVLLVSLILGKASIITGLSYLFGVSFSSAQQCGLLNSQAGEFSFVALGIAETSGLINPQLTKLLLTTVALSMAVTPMLGDLGSAIATRLEEKIDAASRIEADSEADELQFGSNDFLVVAGYGRVGQMVCDILDKKFVKYVAIDRSPTRSTDARVKGLPVFYGDITKPEVLKSFGVNDATAVVLALSDPLDTNKAVEAIKNFSPDVPIFARAKNADHKNLLEGMYSNVKAMSPVLPEDSVLLTLPFGGAVLQKLGVPKVEIDAILEQCRKSYMEEKAFGDSNFDFLDSFRQRLPEVEEESSDAAREDEVFASMEDYTLGVSGSQDDEFTEMVVMSEPKDVRVGGEDEADP